MFPALTTLNVSSMRKLTLQIIVIYLYANVFLVLFKSAGTYLGEVRFAYRVRSTYIYQLKQPLDHR